MKILVTGGLGYIGRVFAERCRDHHQVTLLDNFSNTTIKHMEGVDIFDVDVAAPFESSAVLRSFREADLVVHLAATASVTAKANEVFPNNMNGLVNVLDAMVAYDNRAIVFASSAAVYGRLGDTHGKLGEFDANTVELNSYGQSKFMGERILDYYYRDHGINFIGLRFFNVVGAGKTQGEARPQEHHLLPRLIKGALTGETVSIHASMNIKRDYVHVIDAVNAIGRAGEAVRSPSKIGTVYNVCTGTPTTIQRLVDLVERMTNKTINLDLVDRRTGSDPDMLVGNPDKIKQELGWVGSSELDLMVHTALNWFRQQS